MADPKVIARVRKILELANNGVGGERENATKVLVNAMRKYGLTYDDLGVEEKKEYEFHFKGDFERRLLINTIAHIINEATVEFRRYKRNRTSLFFELTAAQAVECEFIFMQVKKAWEKDVDLFFTAFIAKNGLFAEKHSGKSDPLSPEELEKIENLMNGIDKAQLRKGITHAKK